MPEQGESGQAPAEGQEPAAATAATTETKVEKTEVKEPQTFDADYVKQLRAEAAKHRTEAQEAKAKVQQFEEANQSEVEKAQTKAQKAEQAKAEAEAKLLRYEVAQEKEIPAKLVPLLTASTKDELEKQADLIIENAKGEETTPSLDGGARVPAPEPKSPEMQHNETILRLAGLTPNQ